MSSLLLILRHLYTKMQEIILKLKAQTYSWSVVSKVIKIIKYKEQEFT